MKDDIPLSGWQHRIVECQVMVCERPDGKTDDGL